MSDAKVNLPPPGTGIDPGIMTIVGVDTEDGMDHPLWQPDLTDEADEELAESLGEHGQLQSIVVRRNGPRIEVVAGRERVKAARLWNDAHPEAKLLLHWRLAPRGITDEALVDLVVAENEHRKEKSVVWKARMAERMVSRGRNTSHVARVFRVTPATVREWLATLEVAPAVLEAVEAGEVSAADARAISELTHQDQEAALALAREEREQERQAKQEDALEKVEATTEANRPRIAAARAPAGNRRGPKAAKRKTGKKVGIRNAAGVQRKGPTPKEIRAAVEEPAIADDAIGWRQFGLWVLGDRKILLGEGQ